MPLEINESLLELCLKHLTYDHQLLMPHGNLDLVKHLIQGLNDVALAYHSHVRLGSEQQQ
ncbi:hypothetical protein D9M71_304210 [compost metagenome]